VLLGGEVEVLGKILKWSVVAKLIAMLRRRGGQHERGTGTDL
jgi:hypothetical protein